MPTTPPPTCHKCGRPTPDDEASRSEWLIAQRKGAPDGYMVVRCPDHITKHALMLAGLPQQDSRERILNLLPRGLETETETRYARAFSVGTRYMMSTYRPDHVYHLSSKTFDTTDELLTAMRTIQPDMRRWSIIK